MATDDLTVLIEMHDADLDPHADLSAYGADAEGATELFHDRGPKVSISEQIAADERRENRFRTTLTHEFGHPRDHLARFRGFMHADGYAGFEDLYRSGGIREVACMAHVRRRFVDIHRCAGLADRRGGHQAHRQTLRRREGGPRLPARAPGGSPGSAFVSPASRIRVHPAVFASFPMSEWLDRISRVR